MLVGLMVRKGYDDVIMRGWEWKVGFHCAVFVRGTCGRCGVGYCCGVTVVAYGR